MSDAVWVIVGIIIGIGGPTLIEYLRNTGKKKRIIKALLIEVERNQVVANTTKIAVGEVIKALDTKSYYEAKESGVLLDLPEELYKNALETYEMIPIIRGYLATNGTDPEEFMDLWNEMVKKWAPLASALKKLLKIEGK